IVGVNKYRLEKEQRIEVLQIDNAKVRESQIAKLKHIKENRDADRARRALENITEVAKSNGNLMDAAIEAASARCTVGEISDAMEKVFSRFVVVFFFFESIADQKSCWNLSFVLKFTLHYNCKFLQRVDFFFLSLKFLDV
uniref:METMALONYL_COA_MUTASE domain-containing protein n=1 Tax=Ascaris lumbricoides TaxID=6252 RepID=A0A0M3HHC8_ASCLU